MINQDTCIACGLCVPYCPMGAIELKDEYAEIVYDECVECNVCYRVGICPTDSFEKHPLEWPRSIRAIYSDPLNVHKETGLAGRGTEETKTNDVTGRFREGCIGVAVEIGRPGIGGRMRELEKFSKALAMYGVEFEPLNPLTNLIDAKTGEMPEEILNEKVLSAIIEFAIPNEKTLEALEIIRETAETIDTVVSVDLATRAGKDGTWPTVNILDEAGIYYRPNAKVNVGLGKPYKD